MHKEIYLHHLDHDYKIEIPTNESEGNELKIKVYNTQSKKIIKEEKIILKKIPEKNGRGIELSKEDKKTLSDKIDELFCKLNFD